MPYFRGSAQHLGSVSALPAPTPFAGLFTVPVTLAVTRAEFRAQERAQQDRTKRSEFLVAAEFASSPSQRITALAKRIALLFLDIDESEHTLPLLGDPSRFEALNAWGHCVYHTASSTEEKPRLRVVVDASLDDVGLYPQAVQTIAALLQLPSVTTESMVAVQPMYLPAIFADEDVLSSPVIRYHTEGGVFTAADVSKDPVLTPQDKAASPTSSLSAPDDLDYLRPPVDGLTLEDCAACLTHVDPDLPYAEWLTVAAALRHQYPHDPQRGEALDLFIAWSRKGAKFTNEKDCLAKWDSLKPQPRGRLPITIRSLLHMAERAGWRKASAVERLCAACMAWIRDPQRRLIDLTSYGAKKIAAVPLITNVDRGILVQALIDRLAVFSVKVTKTDIMQDIHRLEARQRAYRSEIDPVAEGEMPPWVRGTCYVSSCHLFARRASGQRWTPPSFDAAFGAYLCSAGESRPAHRPQDYALNILRIPRVDDIRYDPTTPETYVLDGPRRFLNSYIADYPTPDLSRMAEAEDMMQRHLELLFKEPQLRTLMLDWMCHVVQKPGKKIRWAPLIQGAKGCGKTTLSEVMSAVLGRRNVFNLDGRKLTDSQYNEWAEGHQVITLEEVRIVGESRTAIMNSLKPLITNQYVAISQKYRDLRQVPNTANYLLLTNHQDCIPVTEDERRYCVMFSQIQDRKQVLEMMGPEYFRGVYAQIEGNAGGLRAFLEARTISSEFDADGHAPVTEYHAQLEEFAASPLHAAVIEAIRDGSPLVNERWISMSHLVGITKDDTRTANPQTCAAVLREMGYRNQGRMALPGGLRTHIWSKGEFVVREDVEQALVLQTNAEACEFLS